MWGGGTLLLMGKGGGGEEERGKSCVGLIWKSDNMSGSTPLFTVSLGNFSR